VETKKRKGHYNPVSSGEVKDININNEADAGTHVVPFHDHTLILQVSVDALPCSVLEVS
jgi:hypothetical protein